MEKTVDLCESGLTQDLTALAVGQVVEKPMAGMSDEEYEDLATNSLGGFEFRLTDALTVLDALSSK